MGRIINPGEIKAQASSMTQKLQAENDDLVKIVPVIDSFVIAGALQGKAWSSQKNHLKLHQSLIRGLISANESVIEDNETLINNVGDEVLDEYMIEEKIREEQNLIYNYEEWINWYQSLDNSVWSSSYIAAQIFRYRGLIFISERIISSLERKLQKIGEIEILTSDLYIGAETLYNHVNMGTEAIRSAWDGSGFVMPKNLGWKMALDTSWKNQILEKQIKVAKEKYMSVDDSGNNIYNWESIEEFMKKNPDEISEVEYAAMILVLDSMVRMDENGNGRLDEENLAKFLNLGYEYTSIIWYKEEKMMDRSGKVQIEKIPQVEVTASVTPAFQVLQAEYEKMVNRWYNTYGHVFWDGKFKDVEEERLNAHLYINGVLKQSVTNLPGMSSSWDMRNEPINQKFEYVLNYESDSSKIARYSLKVSVFGVKEIEVAHIYGFNTEMLNVTMESIKGIAIGEKKALGALALTEAITKETRDILLGELAGAISGSIPFVGPAYNVANAGINIGTEIKEARELNETMDRIVNATDMAVYAHVLYIGGDFSIFKGDSSIQMNHVYVNEKRLEEMIIAYNGRYNRNVTKEELLDDFVDFMTTGNESERLVHYRIEAAKNLKSHVEDYGIDEWR